MNEFYQTMPYAQHELDERRPIGFGGFGGFRPWGFGRPFGFRPWGFARPWGFGGPFLGGLVGGLATSALLGPALYGGNPYGYGYGFPGYYW
ncbi:hypothetical protein [Heyndrickxia ginsengihumi]|uniref:hypothetical protein n=1 Tax=Heyndrickxia ginsengihumi TaxID=363870 RepID=UPI00203F41C0|nr:hypothetical protein [Heyndrickxia ginsengihumi]MCM3024050.1 hypothetical protein [Heyndrickxia ginsengihumi]